MDSIVPDAGSAARSVLDSLMVTMADTCSEAYWAFDPSRVKRARITARRLRTTLELFGGRGADAEVREVDRATSRLGALRDLDVIGDLLADDLNYLPAGEATSGVLPPRGPAASERSRRSASATFLRSRLAAERERARIRVQDQTTPEQLELLAQTLVGFQLPPETSGQELTAFAAPRLGRRYRRARQLAGQMAPDDFASVHRLRRALRRVRYDVEALLPWFSTVRPQLKAIRATLDVLGEMADVEAAIAWLGKHEQPRQALEAKLAAIMLAVPAAVEPLFTEEFEIRLTEAFQGLTRI